MSDHSPCRTAYELVDLVLDAGTFESWDEPVHGRPVVVIVNEFRFLAGRARPSTHWHRPWWMHRAGRWSP